MNETSDPKEGTIIEQLRRVLKDAVDYASSGITLLQAKITSMALSGIVFVVFLALAALLVLAAMALLSVAFGIWLAHVTGSTVGALLILGGVLALLGLILSRVALGWLNRLNS